MTNDPSVEAAVAEAIANVRDMFAPVREATTGYRSQLITEGITSTEADRMAADFHHMLMTIVTKGINEAPK
jgi:hypothetical protein